MEHFAILFSHKPVVVTDMTAVIVADGAVTTTGGASMTCMWRRVVIIA